MVLCVSRRLRDLLDDMGRARQIGIAHAEVDDVLSSSARGAHECDHFTQAVGGKPSQFVEVVAKLLGHGDRVRFLRFGIVFSIALQLRVPLRGKFGQADGAMDLGFSAEQFADTGHVGTRRLAQHGVP